MKKLILCFVFLLLSASGYGLTKYGSVTVNKGDLTILRDGKRLSFSAGEKSIKVMKKDVLRAGKNSLITLNTVQQTSVELGSHAIFQVRPFKIGNKTGYLRMLFGKARFQTTGFTKENSRRFRLRTATAVIGVKGTEWIQQTNSNGVTDTEVLEGIVGISTETGLEIDVNIGRRAVALSNRKISKPIKVKKVSIPPDSDDAIKAEQQEKDEAVSKRLEAVSPTSSESVKIDSQDSYVEQEVLSIEDFKEAERETVSINEDIAEQDEKDQSKEEKKGESEEKETTEEDEVFEEDIKESEGGADILKLEADFDLSEVETEINTEEIIDDIINNVEQEVEETIEDAVVEGGVKQIRLSVDFEK